MFSDMSFCIKPFRTERALELVSLHLVCFYYMTSQLGYRNLLHTVNYIHTKNLIEVFYLDDNVRRAVKNA